MKDLVKVNHQEFGIQETKAKEIASQFKPMLKKMEELEREYNEVIKLPIDSLDAASKAKKLRLKYVKVRTGTAAIHKEQKAFYLSAGRFVDAWKNTQLFASQGIEEKLIEIEKYHENIEKERLLKIQESRVKELEPFVEDASERDLSSMDEDVWQSYLSTKKQAHLDKIEAELKAEKEREAKLKAEKEEQERIRKENEKLKAEAEERERLAKIESEKRLKAEKERLAKEEAERKNREEKERKEREEYEAKLKKEREERERLESEIKAKKLAEENALKAAEEAKQAELNKGDSEKVKELVRDLQNLKTKYVFKSAKNKKMYQDVSSLIDKVVNHINN